VYHANIRQEIIDTVKYIYSNDTLIRMETIHYTESMSSPPVYGYKTIKLIDYKLSENLLIITLISEDKVQGYQEQYYGNNNLISIRTFDTNRVETGNLGYEYNIKENSIGFTINGLHVKKIWYDEKNSPVKCLNIFNSKNRHFSFDNIMSQVTYSGSGFLISDHNPTMILEGTDTLRYTYDYNEYDFPTACYMSDSHNHQYSYDCGGN
jgi:hypothetical protein